MKQLLVAVSIIAILLSPAGAWAGGYGHGHHHHGNHHEEYLALGILGGFLGGIVLGQVISEHTQYTPPPRVVYVPRPVYRGPAYGAPPPCAPYGPCYR